MNIFRLIIYIILTPIYILGWPMFLARFLANKADLNPWDDATIIFSLYMLAVFVTIAWLGFIGFLVSNYV